MGNLARKFMNAVQNSMLDKLFERLVSPLLGISAAWSQLSTSESDTGFWALFLAVTGLWLLYSLLGVIADQSPKPRQRTPYDPVYDYPSNSSSAWDQQRKDGLRPPAPIRAFVMTFGVRGQSWIWVIEGLMFIGALTLAGMLAYKSQAFWSGVHQGLAQQATREQLFLAASVVLTVLVIRGWAVEQRQQLSPSPAPGLPVFGSILLGAAFTAMLGMIVSDLLGFGLLPGVIWGLGLLAVAVGPPWREKVLEFLFGKRDPAGAGP